jgi:hypothetical protein
MACLLELALGSAGWCGSACQAFRASSEPALQPQRPSPQLRNDLCSQRGRQRGRGCCRGCLGQVQPPVQAHHDRGGQQQRSVWRCEAHLALCPLIVCHRLMFLAMVSVQKGIPRNKVGLLASVSRTGTCEL